MLSLEREKRFHQLLVAALDHGPDERRRFLAESCGEDGELLDDVCAAAFRGEADLGSFLDAPALGTSVTRVDRGASWCSPRRCTRATGCTVSWR
ncbi:MAG TPA: hypothetical protein VGG06_10045 [Thermoanaerobaculia bacterium]|jgi:hypothetical protein